MKNCTPKPRTIKAMLLQNPKVIIRSFEQSLPIKISTDSPNAGGVIMESNTESNLNKELLAGKPELCFATNKGLTRINEVENIIFPYSCETLSEFNDRCKKSNLPMSSADLFLLQVCGKDFLCLRDGVSFKSSTSKSVKLIYAHNDPSGQIYNACLHNRSHTMGQILFILYDEQELICCYFDKCLTKITSLFKQRKINNGEMTYHGSDCSLSLTQKQGSMRTLLSLTNRQKKTKKKNSNTALASTSFNRGVKIDKEFLKVLVDEGIVDLILKEKLVVDSISKEDYESRYPQLL
tara:strand:+ start:822 stop:1700 length:879 start_codon:yes stop_codon:yes gene_type:complete